MTMKGTILEKVSSQKYNRKVRMKGDLRKRGILEAGNSDASYINEVLYEKRNLMRRTRNLSKAIFAYPSDEQYLALFAIVHIYLT